MASRVYAAVLAGALLGAAAAQEPPAIEPPPELTPAQAQSLDREIDKLRNNNAPGRAKSEAVILEFGRGAVPALVKAAHTRHAGQQEGLLNCLLVLTDLDDRGLVEESLASPHVTLRRFGARRAGELKLPLMDKLPPLLADADEAVRTEAALALVANGREEGLPVVALVLGGPQAERARAALRGIAGKGDHANLAAMLVIDKERERFEPEVASKERMAAVDLLHAIGDPASQALLVRALDDHHNIVQRMAINALRDLLEKQPPLDGSSIFQQIREVERLKQVWKERT